MGKAHYINATLHFFLFALALLEHNGQSPLLSPQWLDLQPTQFLRFSDLAPRSVRTRRAFTRPRVCSTSVFCSLCTALRCCGSRSVGWNRKECVLPWSASSGLGLYRGKSHHIVFLHLPIYWIQTTLQRRYYWQQIAAMMKKAILSCTPIEPFTSSSKVYSPNILKRNVWGR